MKQKTISMLVCTSIVVIGIIVSGCSYQTSILTPTSTVSSTATVATSTTSPFPSPSLVPSKKPSATPELWKTPPSEVLLNYDPTKISKLAPPSKYTEIAAKQEFRFTNPIGFKFRNSTYQSIMENKEQTIMIVLEFFEHKGKANALGYLGVQLKSGLYNAASDPKAYNLGKYQGWIMEIESPSIYDNGKGQIIIVDIDSSNLFSALVLAKKDYWDPEAKQIFADVINSITFPNF